MGVVRNRCADRYLMSRTRETGDKLTPTPLWRADLRWKVVRQKKNSHAATAPSFGFPTARASTGSCE